MQTAAQWRVVPREREGRWPARAAGKGGKEAAAARAPVNNREAVQLGNVHHASVPKRAERMREPRHVDARRHARSSYALGPGLGNVEGCAAE